MGRAEEIKDGILAVIQKQVEPLDPADLAELSKYALDLGKLTVQLELATSDPERESIKHEIRGANANIQNQLAVATMQGGDFLKGLAKGVFSVLTGILGAQLPPPLGALLSSIKL